MPNKIHVTNMDTISKRLLGYLLVGVLGFLGFTGIKALDSYYISKKYSDRKKAVSTCIDQGKIYDARSLLEIYSKENALEKADVEKLKLDINTYEVDLAKQTELNKEEDILNSLENLILEENFEKASNLFQTLKKEGRINPEIESSYLERIKNISLDGLLSRAFNSTSLEDKIKIAEKILLRYPNCEKAAELRKVQADAYLKIAESYFKTNSESNVLNFLTGFNKWLRNQDPAFVKSIDFSNFLLDGQIYLSKIADKEYDPNIEVGDRVKIVKSLGSLNGNKPNEDYYNGGSIKSAPLSTQGTVTSKNTSAIYVSLDNGIRYHFVPRELEKIHSQSEDPLVYQQFNLVKEYINNPGGKK